MIIGCGNIDRGDDGAGILVARRLREMGIEAREESGEALALLEQWSEDEEVILVDAVVTGARRNRDRLGRAAVAAYRGLHPLLHPCVRRG